MTPANKPFYAALGRVAGSQQEYEFRYFRSEADAHADAEGVQGAYVVKTSPTPGIWRSTRPTCKGEQ